MTQLLLLLFTGCQSVPVFQLHCVDLQANLLKFVGSTYTLLHKIYIQIQKSFFFYHGDQIFLDYFVNCTFVHMQYRVLNLKQIILKLLYFIDLLCSEYQNICFIQSLVKLVSKYTLTWIYMMVKKMVSSHRHFLFFAHRLFIFLNPPSLFIFGLTVTVNSYFNAHHHC